MSTKIEAWPLGLDNVSADHSMPEGALRTASGVLLDKAGTVKTAPGWRLGDGVDGLTALYEREGQVFAVVNDEVGTLSGASFASLGVCGRNARLVEFGAQLLAVSNDGVFVVGDQVQPIAEPVPAFSVEAVASGGLTAGRYGVAVAALRDGQEFGLSALRFVDVVEGGGLSVSVAGAGMARIYRTAANGNQLYRASDAPAGLSDYMVGNGNLGAMPSSQNLSPMPGGTHAAIFAGWLLVARGRALYYSQPMRPALTDPRFDYVLMPDRITMVCAVDGGVFVGTTKEMVFLSGLAPGEWVQRKLAALPPPDGCYANAEGGLFGEAPDVPLAVWLSEAGFVLGMPDGSTQSPQRARLKINTRSKGSLAVVNRRLYALTY